MKNIRIKGSTGMGSLYDLPGYEYDPVNDNFTDTATGKVFSKDSGDVSIESNVAETITENGSVEITPSDSYDAMAKATVTVAVPVPALEDNKAVTVDVSTYTEPIEIEATAGKDGMVKVTLTLTNIPSA